MFQFSERNPELSGKKHTQAQRGGALMQSSFHELNFGPTLGVRQQTSMF
jgi:hypothetical protein